MFPTIVVFIFFFLDFEIHKLSYKKNLRRLNKGLDT